MGHQIYLKVNHSISLNLLSTAEREIEKLVVTTEDTAAVTKNL
jgi:hypothetical protein